MCERSMGVKPGKVHTQSEEEEGVGCTVGLDCTKGLRALSRSRNDAVEQEKSHAKSAKDAKEQEIGFR